MSNDEKMFTKNLLSSIHDGKVVVPDDFCEIFKISDDRNNKYSDNRLRKIPKRLINWSAILDINFGELSFSQRCLLAHVFINPLGWKYSEKFLIMRFGVVETLSILNMLVGNLTTMYSINDPCFYLIGSSNPVHIIWSSIDNNKYPQKNTLGNDAEKYCEFKGYRINILSKLPKFANIPDNLKKEIILESSPIIIRKNAYMKPYMQCMVLDSFAKSGICYVPNPQYEN